MDLYTIKIKWLDIGYYWNYWIDKFTDKDELMDGNWVNGLKGIFILLE